MSEHRPEPTGKGADIGLLGWLRWAWRQLTSMRTALLLLLLLALATLPGSLIPQGAIDPIAVREFKSAHRTLGPIYTRLGLFDVYSTAWFAAIYLLLFTSLVGCVVPRALTYARALRAAPPRTPRNLDRLKGYARFEVETTGGTHGTAATPEVVIDTAEQVLARRRYRVGRHGGSGTAPGSEAAAEPVSVSGERGYLRELGNLVFHLSLLVTLVGMAISAVFGYRGSVLVVVGNGFSNVLSQYDDFGSGRAVDPDDLPPFSLTVDDFQATFQMQGPQRGAARSFNARISFSADPSVPPRALDLTVNHPINVDGASIFLLGHGYAPVVTVRDGAGNVAYSGPAPFLPQDGNFTSFGVVKAPDGRPQQLGFQGFFLPTGVIDDLGPRSVFPDTYAPLLVLTGFHGRPAPATSAPQSVYELDTKHLTQFLEASGDKTRFALTPGQSVTLPDQLGSLRFDGYKRWVKLQVSHQPGLGLALGGLIAAVAGLMLSLFVNPRRAWVRARRHGGRTVVEVAGLDRTTRRDLAGLQSEVDQIAEQLRSGPPGSTERDGPTTDETRPARAEEPTP